MNIPLTPRYYNVYDKIIDFFFEFHLVDYPISPLNVINDIVGRCYNISAISYKEFESIICSLKNDDEAIALKMKTRDGFIALHQGFYYIVYNNQIHSQRINFTLMHELGHFYLGHLVDFKNTLSSDGVFFSSDYCAIETEANVFARNILAPIFLIDHFRIPWSDVSGKFDISFEAAHARYDFAKNDRRNLGNNVELLLSLFGLNAFSDAENASHGLFVPQPEPLQTSKFIV